MARTSQRPPHVGTIGEDRRRNMTLRIFCLKHSCRHNAKADLDAHCARYGGGMPVSVFVALSRCSRCGARWPDLAITVTPDSPQVVSHGKSDRVQPPPDMNIRITVEFAKAETVVSRFVFICNREQDLGAGVDAAVTFFRRQHPNMSLFDESVCLRFEKE